MEDAHHRHAVARRVSPLWRGRPRLRKSLWRGRLAVCAALAVAGALASGCAGPEAQRRRTVEALLRLRIETPKAAYRVGEPLRIEATITNNGYEPIRLLQPGDGSHRGWRAPELRWHVERVMQIYRRDQRALPAVKREAPRPIAPVRLDQVKTLAPGETMELDLLGTFPVLSRPGTHVVRLRYTNDPARAFRPPRQGEHDRDVMALVRRTAACRLVSNSVEIEILPERVAEPSSE